MPAYAATVHKSQGSEYPAVVIPMLTQHYAMLKRNLLYTGVTRGKRLAVLEHFLITCGHILRRRSSFGTRPGSRCLWLGRWPPGVL